MSNPKGSLDFQSVSELCFTKVYIMSMTRSVECQYHLKPQSSLTNNSDDLVEEEKVVPVGV